MSDPKNSDPKLPESGKRPYATLDLKAKEIKVTPVVASSASSSSEARAAADTMVPRPAAPADYTAKAAPGATRPVGDATAASAAAATAAHAKTADPASKPTVKNETPSGPNSAAARPATQTASSEAAGAPVLPRKRGGVLSHLAAGLAGGVLALAGSELVMPQLGLQSVSDRSREALTEIDRRLIALEKGQDDGALAGKVAVADQRIAALEKSSQNLTAAVDAHGRLEAEVKRQAAALSAATSGDGAARLSQLEQRFASLVDAGANDPNSGRVAQLAALTGKVSDVEANIATQFAALRKSFTDDVDARVALIAEASETAKAGTQRLDRDVATLRTDTTRIGERVQGVKTDADRLAEAMRGALDQLSAVKAQIEALRTSAAKPEDVASAIRPLAEKLAGLEQNVVGVVKSEADRRSNAERIVLSLELQNLKRVLDRGQPYAAELAEVQKVGAGKIDLAALNRYKDTGVATLSDLVREFRDIANAVIDAEGEPVDGSVMDRLLAGAKSVVRVRKLEHAADDKSVEATVGRMEAALAEGRLGDVLTENKRLPVRAQSAAAALIEKVNARFGIDRAVGELEAQLKLSLTANTAQPPQSVQ